MVRMSGLVRGIKLYTLLCVDKQRVFHCSGDFPHVLSYFSLTIDISCALLPSADYTRKDARISENWIASVKLSLDTLGHAFSCSDAWY